jgi:hypothetical protein
LYLTKNKIVYSFVGIPFRPLTVSRYPINWVPRLMKCCIRGYGKRRRGERLEWQNTRQKIPKGVAKILTSSKGGVAELPNMFCSSLSSILTLFGKGLGGWRQESTFGDSVEEARFLPPYDESPTRPRFVTCSSEQSH